MTTPCVYRVTVSLIIHFIQIGLYWLECLYSLIQTDSAKSMILWTCVRQRKTTRLNYVVRKTCYIRHYTFIANPNTIQQQIFYQWRAARCDVTLYYVACEKLIFNQTTNWGNVHAPTYPTPPSYNIYRHQYLFSTKFVLEKLCSTLFSLLFWNDGRNALFLLPPPPAPPTPPPPPYCGIISPSPPSDWGGALYGACSCLSSAIRLNKAASDSGNECTIFSRGCHRWPHRSAARDSVRKNGTFFR